QLSLSAWARSKPELKRLRAEIRSQIGGKGRYAMDVMGIGLFKLASRRLSSLATRHQVIAENVSNANTPGFVARDLKPFEAALEEAEVRLARTRPGHMSVAWSTTASSAWTTTRRSGRSCPAATASSSSRKCLRG